MRISVSRVPSLNLPNLLGHDPLVVSAHADCIRRSTSIWLGKIDDLEACAIGVIPATLFSEDSYVWMISTPLCRQHPLALLRWSKKTIDEILDLYPSLIGYCHCDNLSAHRWLAWLGAKFDFDHPQSGHFCFRFMRNG